MSLNLESCPLLTYMESHPIADCNVELIQEMRDAALTGDVDLLYSYGLMLCDMAHNETMYPQFNALPAAVKKAMDAKAFEVFVHTAQAQHPESALMAGYMLINGYGTDQDARSAALFFQQAQASISPSDPRVKALAQTLADMGRPVPAREGAPVKPLLRSFKKSSDKKDEHPPVTIDKSDIAAVLAPLTAPVATVDNMYLTSALGEMIRWVEDGFKNEDDKGSLYHALIRSTAALSDIIGKSPNQDKSVVVDAETLGMLKLGYCQLNEAALQVGGVAPELRNIWLPNFGQGHAPAQHKGMGDRLRTVSGNFDKFFEKYAIPSPTDKDLEHYATQPVKKAHNYGSGNPKLN